MARLGIALLAISLVAPIGCASARSESNTVPQSGSSVVDDTPIQVRSSQPGEIPVGQELDVRIQTPLSSETAEVEQRFETTTVADLVQDGRVLIPAGSKVRGVVRDVDHAGRIDRTGKLTLAFDQIVVGGRQYPLRALATEVYQSQGIREEAGTVGVAGGAGAIVGGILGGLKGALIGAIVGGGGAIAATDGKDVMLPAGTIVRLRVDAPLRLR